MLPQVCMDLAITQCILPISHPIPVPPRLCVTVVAIPAFNATATYSPGSGTSTAGHVLNLHSQGDVGLSPGACAVSC